MHDNVRGRLPDLLRHVDSATSIDHGSENGQGFESPYDRQGKDLTTNTINSGKIEPPKPSPLCALSSRHSRRILSSNGPIDLLAAGLVMNPNCSPKVRSLICSGGAPSHWLDRLEHRAKPERWAVAVGGRRRMRFHISPRLPGGQP